MNNETNFCVCKQCGNLVELILDKDVPIVCCGENMKKLIPNTMEGSTEKHLPSITYVGNKIEVAVGSILHPMEDMHNIIFICLKTKNGIQRKKLNVSDKPIAIFSVEDDIPLLVYAYCNIHGLWKTDI